MLLLVLLAFVLISSACFGILMLFIRGGRNRSDDVPTPGGRRALAFGALTPALAGMLPAGTQFREQCTRFLRQAGHYHPQTLSEFLSLRNALVVGAVLLIATTIVVVTQPGDGLTVPLAIGGVVVRLAVVRIAAPGPGIHGKGPNAADRGEPSGRNGHGQHVRIGRITVATRYLSGERGTAIEPPRSGV